MGKEQSEERKRKGKERNNKKRKKNELERKKKKFKPSINELVNNKNQCVVVIKNDSLLHLISGFGAS